MPERPSGAFRLPEQRPTAGYRPADPLSTTGSHALPDDAGSGPGFGAPRMPVRGPEYPTIRPTAMAETPPPVTYGAPSRPEQPAPVAGPTSLVPPVGADRFAPTPADSVYRTRRAPSSFAVAIGMVVLLVPVVRLLLQATFTGDPTARNIVPAVLLTLGFVLTGVGLFALAGDRPPGRQAWLRPPVAYLPAGLVLLLAAGLAVA